MTTDSGEKGTVRHDDCEAAARKAAEARQRLVDAILDIDAHATPYGEDEDGYVNGGYLISIGCLHRALGIVGHSAAKCRHCGPEAHGCADAEALVDTAALALEYARKVEAGTADTDDISTLVCHLVLLTQDLPEALNTPQSVFLYPQHPDDGWALSARSPECSCTPPKEACDVCSR